MSSLLSMPNEILYFIFDAIQSFTAGPQYVLRQPLIDSTRSTRLSRIEGDIVNEPRLISDLLSDTFARWILEHSGLLHFAASCKGLREIYFSPISPFNLVLEIADPPDLRSEVDKYYNFWPGKLSIESVETSPNFPQRKTVGKIWLSVKMEL